MLIKNALILLAILSLIFFLEGCQKELAPVNDSSSGGGGGGGNTDTIPVYKIDSSLYTVSGTGGSPGGQIFLTFTSDSAGVLTVLNQDGYVLKEKSLPVNVANFQKWIINGQTRYTYFHAPDLKAGLGYEDICDSDFNVIKEVRLLSYGNIDANVEDKLDEHEFILLGDDHYIIEAQYVETVSNIPDSVAHETDVKVDANIIQEVENGQVIFQWDGTQYPEFYASSVENNNFLNPVDTLDYMHMNSICIDSTDNNLIVSFRNLNEIVKLNRQTGDIMWRLGGKNSDFAQTDDQLFLRQHYPRLIDNGQTLIFLDNGQISLRPYSRILEFQLDQVNKTIKSFTAYVIPDKFIQYAGSVKKEGNNYFIGAGSVPYSLEINYLTNDVLLRLNQKYGSYRAIKYNN